VIDGVVTRTNKVCFARAREESEVGQFVRGTRVRRYESASSLFFVVRSCRAGERGVCR
jgi:hypothetical protein